MSKFGTKESQVERFLRHPDVTLNYEAALAFHHDLRHTLAHMASCCLVNERSFYEDTTGKVDAMIREAARLHPEWTAKLAVYLREQLHLRSISQRVAAIVATEPAARPALARALPRIFERPDDALELASLLKDERHGLARRIPNVVRRCLADRLGELDEVRAIKYRRGAAFGMKHLLRLCHPRPGRERQSLLFCYLLDPGCWQSMSADQRALLPKVAAYEELKRVPRHHWMRIRDLVKTGQLPWELVLPQLGASKQVWKILAPQMPIMALIRNLRNLHASGALKCDTVRKAVVDKLRTPEVIVNSRQLPFRWLAAHRVMKELDAEIADALTEALNLSVANLPPWAGRTFIACDNSGSMTACPISRRSTLYPRDIANLLGAMAFRFCDSAVVSVFACEFAVVPISKHDSIFANRERVDHTYVSGSTNAHLALDYLNRQRLTVDRIVVLTDMQIWDSSGLGPGDDRDLRALLIRYRRNVNPAVPTYIINLQPYEHFVTPQNEAGVTYISGWSEGVLRYVALDSFDLVEEIERVSLGEPTLCDNNHERRQC